MTRKEEIEQASKKYYNEVKYLSCLSATPINAFKVGAEWADKTMLESIISYLNNININDYVSSITSGIGIINFDIKKLCDNIRNAMEE